MYLVAKRRPVVECGGWGALSVTHDMASICPAHQVSRFLFESCRQHPHNTEQGSGTGLYEPPPPCRATRRPLFWQWPLPSPGWPSELTSPPLDTQVSTTVQHWVNMSANGRNLLGTDSWFMTPWALKTKRCFGRFLDSVLGPFWIHRAVCQRVVRALNLIPRCSPFGDASKWTMERSEAEPETTGFSIGGTHIPTWTVRTGLWGRKCAAGIIWIIVYDNVQLDRKICPAGSFLLEVGKSQRVTNRIIKTNKILFKNCFTETITWSMGFID